MAYQQFTRTQLRAMVYDALGQPANTFWRDTEVNQLIQEALRVWNTLTGYWRTRVATEKTVANQVWYTVPGTITSAMRMEWNGKPLAPTSLYDLDFGRPNWEGETTTSGGSVPSEPQMWTPAGLTLVAIWPADAVAQDSLVYDGVAATPILSVDDAYIDIGREELTYLLDYIQHIAVFKEGGAEFEATLPLMQEFLQGAAEKNAQLRANARFREWMGIHTDERAKSRRDEPEKVGIR